MKIQIESDFFCSYFYQVTKQSIKRLNGEGKHFRKYYHALTAVVMAQGVLESYINHLIYNYSIENRRIIRKKLIDLPIKEKWIEVPKIISQKSFDQTSTHYKDFEELVNLRNKLIHFHSKKMNMTIEFEPSDPPTYADIESVVCHEEMTNIIFFNLLTLGTQALSIVNKMIVQLHNMIGTDIPRFLKKEDYLKIRVIET